MEEFTLTIKYKTDKAFLLTDGVIEAWFPRSVIDWEEPDDIGCTTKFYIPEYWAKEKELI